MQYVFWTHFVLCSHRKHLPTSGPGFTHHVSPRTPNPSHTPSPSCVTCPHHTLTQIGPTPGGGQPPAATEQYASCRRQPGGSFPQGGPHACCKQACSHHVCSFWQPWPCCRIVYCSSILPYIVATYTVVQAPVRSRSVHAGVYCCFLVVRHALSWRLSSSSSPSAAARVVGLSGCFVWLFRERLARWR